MTRILVVEDEVSQLQTILAILRSNGFEAMGADNGVSGAEMTKTYLPDLVVSDIHMNSGDGYDMLANLRNDTVTATSTSVH